MDKQESNDWQLDRAIRMRGLVSVPANMDLVREQDRAFYEKCNAWKKENDAYEQEIQHRDNEGKDAHGARIEQVKKPRPNPCDLLALPEYHRNSQAAHAAALTECLFGKELAPSLGPQQARLSACVLLTLLHDDKLEDDPRTERINNDIWPMDEDWAQEKQRELREKATSEKVQAAIDYALKLVEDMLLGQSAEKEQKSDSQTATKKKRPTQAEMNNRNRAVAMTAAKFKMDHDRLPNIDDIVTETGYPREKIYPTNAYKEGKIANRSTKTASEMIGGSVVESEHFGRASEQHSRANRRSKAEQGELDAQIDAQKKNEKSRFVE